MIFFNQNIVNGHEKSVWRVEAIVGRIIVSAQTFWVSENPYRTAFALADPALTGQVLGILCMMPFLYQYDFHIFPDFESESYYIRGSYDMKGRIQLIFLLITFIRIVADKDLRLFFEKNTG